MSSTHKRQRLSNVSAVAANPITNAAAVLNKVTLDVLLEIFSWLTPLDLLNLSITAKFLRVILMSKISRSTWRISLKSTYEMPDCPPDLSEPQYGFLIAVHECHDCGKPGIRAVDWALRVRWCPSCSTKNYVTKDSLTNFKYNITDLLPRSVVYRYRFCYSGDQVAKLKERLRQLESNPNDVETFFKDKRASAERITQHAKQCQTAAEKETKKMVEQKKQNQADRLLEIRDRLVNSSPEVGEEVELLDAAMFSRLPGIKGKALLTDKCWERTSPSLISYILDLKPQRVRQERTNTAMNALKQYKDPLLTSGNEFRFLPSVADFCRFPEVEALLDSPFDTVVPRSAFEEILEPSRFTTICTRWLDQIQTTLYNLLSRAWSHEEGVRRLKLATTIFKCRRCGPSNRFSEDLKSMQFPLVVAHPCLQRENIQTNLPIYWDRSTRLRASDKLQRRAWTCDLIFDQETSSQIIVPIIRAAGFEPATATIEDMDKADPWLICRVCTPSSEKDSVEVYTWKKAIEHGETHKSEQSWEALERTDASTVRLVKECLPPELRPSAELLEMAPNWPQFTKDPLRPVWCCAMCYDTPEEPPEPLGPMSMVYHLRNKHGIQHASPQTCFKAPMTPLRLAEKPVKVRSFQLPDQQPRYGVLVPKQVIQSRRIFQEAQTLKSLDGAEPVLQLTSLPEWMQKKYVCQSHPFILPDI